MGAVAAIWKQYDTSPAFQASLTQGGGPLDLTTASSVVVVMRGNKTNTPITGICTVTNASAGAVSYSWGPEDTSQADTYQVEFLITWTGGGLQTVPNDANNNPTIQIAARLAGTAG